MMIMNAILDLIQWDQIEAGLMGNTLDPRQEQMVYCICKILGKGGEVVNSEGQEV